MTRYCYKIFSKYNIIDVWDFETPIDYVTEMIKVYLTKSPADEVKLPSALTNNIKELIDFVEQYPNGSFIFSDENNKFYGIKCGEIYYVPVSKDDLIKMLNKIKEKFEDYETDENEIEDYDVDDDFWFESS